MTENCMSYFNLTIELLHTGSCAVKQFRKQKRLDAVVSHIYFMHESNTQNWNFWNVVVKILLLVTNQYREEKSKKAARFWKANGRVLAILKQIIQKHNVKDALFSTIIELFAGALPSLKEKAVEFLDTMNHEFYGKLCPEQVLAYATFLSTVVPRTPKGDALIQMQLQYLKESGNETHDAIQIMATRFEETKL